MCGESRGLAALSLTSDSSSYLRSKFASSYISYLSGRGKVPLLVNSGASYSLNPISPLGSKNLQMVRALLGS